MISVVIPTHNRCELVARAIESVRNQTYGDIEIIVVSDGSTDATGETVAKAAEKDGRIRFVEYHPAKGGNVARNTGIAESRGEYVAFLDDDDEWYPEKLEKQLAVMESDERIGLVYTGVRVIYVNEKIEYRSKAAESGDLSGRILLDNCIGTTSTVMVRKELFEKTGLFDVALGALQDYDLWIRFCRECRVGAVPEEMIDYYNYTGKKQVSAVTGKYEDAFLHINEKYKDLFAGLSREQLREKQANEYLLLANKALRNGDKKQARSFAAKALKTKRSVTPAIYWLASFTSYKTVLKLRSLK